MKKLIKKHLIKILFVIIVFLYLFRVNINKQLQDIPGPVIILHEGGYERDENGHLSRNYSNSIYKKSYNNILANTKIDYFFNLGQLGIFFDILLPGEYYSYNLFK